MNSGNRAPCVFFDRDGVVNVSPGRGYVLDWSSFEFSPGIFEALRVVRDKGYKAILVTSQKGVGKELMSERGLEIIHENMQSALSREGVPFAGIYAYTGLAKCPYQPKPDPSMILAARADHGLDLENSWLIGDADRDMEMARTAGLKGTIRVQSAIQPETVSGDYTVPSVADLVGLLDRVL